MTKEKQVTVNTYKRAIGDMSLELIVKFQIIVHCFLYGIHITPGKLKCLTVLGVLGECDLTEFCDILVKKEIFTSVDSARNTIADIENKKLIIKDGIYWKKIKLHPDMKIQNNNTIWVNIDMLYRPTDIKENEEMSTELSIKGDTEK